MHIYNGSWLLVDPLVIAKSTPKGLSYLSGFYSDGSPKFVDNLATCFYYRSLSLIEEAFYKVGDLTAFILEVEPDLPF